MTAARVSGVSIGVPSTATMTSDALSEAFSAGLDGAIATTRTPRTAPPDCGSPRMPSQGDGAGRVKNERIAETGAPTTTGWHRASGPGARVLAPGAGVFSTPDGDGGASTAAAWQARTRTATTRPATSSSGAPAIGTPLMSTSSSGGG